MLSDWIKKHKTQIHLVKIVYGGNAKPGNLRVSDLFPFPVTKVLEKGEEEPLLIWVRDFLNSRCPAWDEKGYGDIEINLITEEITHHHYEQVISCQTNKFTLK